MDKCPLCNSDLTFKESHKDIDVYVCTECEKEIPFSKEYSKNISTTKFNMKK